MKKTFVAFALLALVAMPLMAERPATDPEFPTSGEYTINSHPAFNIAVGDQTEVVNCKAQLRLRTSEPYTTADGTRRVDLEIIDWKADGYSELLGGDLHFRMEHDRASEDPSYVLSYQTWNASAPADFPAYAQFAVPYELETPFGKVNGLYGLTSGSISQFPPQGSIFTMKKGDTAEIMANLMPAPLSALSATGEVTPVNVTVRPAACLDDEVIE